LKAIKHIYTSNTLVLSKTLNKMSITRSLASAHRDLKDMQLGGGELDSSMSRDRRK